MPAMIRPREDLDASTSRGADARGLNPAALVLLGVLVGAAVGSMTSVGQAHADGAALSLVNAISPWLAPAFAVGVFARRPWQAAVGGALVCLAELAAYAATAISRGIPQGVAITLFWAVGGLVGGPVFGWAGRQWWRASGRARGLGVALMSGTFLAEAGNYAFRLHYRTSAVLFAVCAAVLYLALGLRRRQHGPAVIWLLAVLPMGVLGELLLGVLLAGL